MRPTSEFRQVWSENKQTFGKSRQSQSHEDSNVEMNCSATEVRLSQESFSDSRMKRISSQIYSKKKSRGNLRIFPSVVEEHESDDEACFISTPSSKFGKENQNNVSKAGYVGGMKRTQPTGKKQLIRLRQAHEAGEWAFNFSFDDEEEPQLMFCDKNFAVNFNFEVGKFYYAFLDKLPNSEMDNKFIYLCTSMEEKLTR